jgi:hypothetical protein
VICDLDVAVAGAGVAGVFTAIASARNGASTAIIDRFGSVGGNIGPGMIVNGNMLSGQPHPAVGYESTVYPGLYGIGKEFVQRYAALGGGSLPPYTKGPNNYAGDASIASYVAQRMLEESGVTLVLSTQVADPILEGNRISGLFVENKSGRQAICAKVVIDATGEADVARRTRAPVLYPKMEYQAVDAHAPTGMGLYYLLGGVDWGRYEAYLREARPSEQDIAWGVGTLGEKHTKGYGPILSLLRVAHEKGEYELTGTVVLGEQQVAVTPSWIGRLGIQGIAQGRIAPERAEELDAGNGVHISALEAALRARIFETAYFWKKYVPGFENSCLLCIAPFLGSRGGPCIEGEYTLTMEDCRAGRRFDDVMYLYGEFRALRYTCEQGQPRWTDVPYRVMLPKGIDGLLAVGRSASGIPDTLLRNRMAAKVMGQACGIAAAMAVKKRISPRQLNVRELQKALLDAGFYLGDRRRLRELSLI